MSKYCNLNITEMYKKLRITAENVDYYEDEKALEIKSICNIVIFPQSFFFPYSYWADNKIEALFYGPGKVNITAMRDSYSVHFYGGATGGHKMRMDDYSIFEYFSLLNCDATYYRVRQRKNKIDRYFGH
jgi:hypothetical protein